MVQKREIVTCILLSLLTCGIYGIIWFIHLTDDVSKVNGDTNATSGGLAFLLTLLTCGIYSHFWAYQMGQKLYSAKTKAGMSATDNSVLYLVLNLFGLGIVNYCLIQNELNEMAGQQ